MPHTQASLTLRPVGSLDRPRRPLSRGFGPAGCPSGSLVSYQLNRQLAGWNLPPLVNRALRAHAKPPDLPSRLYEVLDATIKVQGADFGNIQVYDGKTGTLAIAV